MRTQTATTGKLTQTDLPALSYNPHRENEEYRKTTLDYQGPEFTERSDDPIAQMQKELLDKLPDSSKTPKDLEFLSSKRSMASDVYLGQATTKPSKRYSAHSLLRTSVNSTAKVKPHVFETPNTLSFTLSDGRQVTLPKFTTYEGKKHFFTSLVDEKGNARMTGGLSPETDQKMRTFLTNIDRAIQAQRKHIEQLESRGWAANHAPIISDGKLKDAKAQLQELQRMRQFGIRFFYDVEASNQGKGKAVLAPFQAGPGTGKIDNYGLIETPESVEGMRKIFHRSNASVVKEVQESREFYRGLSVGG